MSNLQQPSVSCNNTINGMLKQEDAFYLLLLHQEVLKIFSLGSKVFWQTYLDL